VIENRLKILLTGRDGQVGWELARALAPLGEVVALSRVELDLTDVNAIEQTMRYVRPQYIVNAAAYTAVDQAETDGVTAYAVNSTAPMIFAREAKRLGATLIHYSTDYVFDGNKVGSYVETDETHPLGVYARSKLLGEEAIRAIETPHLILRTSWVYGNRGRNFLLTMLKLAQHRNRTIRVVNDQFGAPTWSRAIAEATAVIITRLMLGCGHTGTYHLTAKGRTTWYGFIEQAFHETGTMNVSGAPTLQPITTLEYPTAAARPMNSELSCAKLNQEFNVVLPTWEHSLRQCLADMTNTIALRVNKNIDVDKNTQVQTVAPGREEFLSVRKVRAA
jgi:dTDP-4-dehydrorhamnose reductase